MKAQMLKMAGVKTEAAFYKKFPTQEAFMKTHGKAFKAQFGTNAGLLPKPPMDYDPTDISPIPVNPNYGIKQQRASANYQNQSMFDSIGDTSTANDESNFNPMKGIPIVGKLFGAANKWKEEKNQLKKSKQDLAVVDVNLKASQLTPERIQRKYVTPWDNPNASNTLYPSKGTGYTALSKNGNKVGKKAFSGFNFGEQLGFDNQEIMGGLSSTLQDQSAGGAAGGAVGSIFGPGGEIIGSLLGNALDKNPKKIAYNQKQTKNKLNEITFNNSIKGIQNQYQANVKNGGNIVARMGGHFQSAYETPSEEGMTPYENGGKTAFNGDLKVGKGELEPISHNPYLPGTGITYKFNGPSHDKGGIPTIYGDSEIETEGMETVREAENGMSVGQSDLSAQIMGNMVITAKNAELLGDKKFTGMKFKNVDKKLSYKEALQNKKISKATEELNNLDVQDSFDKLRLTTIKASIDGGNQTLAQIAKTKTDLGYLQDAIHEVADTHGLKPDELAKGKLKPLTNKDMMGKYGASIEKAQVGKTIPKFSENYDENKEYGHISETPGALNFTEIGSSQLPNFDSPDNYKKYLDKVNRIFQNPENVKLLIEKAKNFSGIDKEDVRAQINKGKTFEEQAAIVRRLATDSKPGPYHTLVDSFIEGTPGITPADVTKPSLATPSITASPDTKAIPYKRSVLADIYNEALPYLRRSDQEDLDPNQLSGELYSMANNQLEPVQSQMYRPDLATPYGVSYQDIRNANQADYISGQRLAGYNPAAQAILNAQKYSANASTYGQEFRENQGRYDQTYDANRNLLNQAKLTNLGIQDKQYERQAMAKSNTKEATQLALNSISDKYAKHKLENRQLGIMENMYNYRFDKDGRAVNLNPLFQPNIPTVGSKQGSQKQVPVYNADGEIDHYQLEEIKTAKYGKTISKNGSIVKAAKNL